jgi:hypothetical protein
MTDQWQFPVVEKITVAVGSCAVDGSSTGA